MNATQWKKRLVAGVFACAFLPAAYAAAPAANTVIGNQASASYTDAAGNSFTALRWMQVRLSRQCKASLCRSRTH